MSKKWTFVPLVLLCDIDGVIVAAAARDPCPPASLIMQHCNQSFPMRSNINIIIPYKIQCLYLLRCASRNLIKFTSDTEKNLYSIKDTIFINQFPPN